MTHGRKACRSGRRCEIRSVMEALYCVVHHSDVDAKTLAEFLGVRHGWLLDLVNPDHDDARRQLAVLVPLTSRTGRFDILDQLEAEVGRVAFQMPAVDRRDEHADVWEALASSMQELGGLSGHLRETLEDGSVSPLEAEQAGIRIDRLVTAAVRLKALITASVKVAPVSIRRHA